MTDFISGVNRVLRVNTILSADDDDITSFTNTQHQASIKLAEIAIQQTLTSVVSDRLIPYEYTDGTITYVVGQRLYNLPSDFVRMADDPPFLVELDSSSNATGIFVQKYPGGENRLKHAILNYRSQSGTPRFFYYANGTTKQIGLFQVPDATVNGTVARFSYEKDVFVTSESDTLPFRTTQAAYAFLDMASRRFQFLFVNKTVSGIEQDSVYKDAKVALLNLLRYDNPSRRYGHIYR